MLAIKNNEEVNTGPKKRTEEEKSILIKKHEKAIEELELIITEKNKELLDLKKHEDQNAEKILIIKKTLMKLGNKKSSKRDSINRLLGKRKGNTLEQNLLTVAKKNLLKEEMSQIVKRKPTEVKIIIFIAIAAILSFIWMFIDFIGWKAIIKLLKSLI